MRSIEVEHYPLRIGEDPETVDKLILDQMTRLCFETPLFYENRGELLWYMYAYYTYAWQKFSPERKMREYGNPNADLHYHNADHAVYQTGFDAIAITRATLSREDKLSANLSLEGAFSVPIAAFYHDVGYVRESNPFESFVAKTPIHVGESIKSAMEAINQIGLPKGINEEKVRKLVEIGIQRTSFPYDDSRRAEGRRLLEEVPQKWRKEGLIVGLEVHFADLQGQSARIDQFPHGLISLRREMNIMEDQKGDIIIGRDHDEMEEKWECFLEFIRKTVGKTGRAFFGSENSFEKDLYVKTPASSR